MKLEGVVDHFKSESALHAAMQLDMIAKDSTIKEMEVEKTKMAKEIERLETKYHDVESRLQSAFKTMRSMKVCISNGILNPSLQQLAILLYPIHE